jgi:hypothetical protein
MLSWWYGDKPDPDGEWHPERGCLLVVATGVLFWGTVALVAYLLWRSLRH